MAALQTCVGSSLIRDILTANSWRFHLGHTSLYAGPGEGLK
jgi:hypothetical protein